VPTGSGDRTFDYVQVLCLWVLAALAALAWTWVDRRPDRRRDRRLREGLRIYLRYALALMLLSYGMSKAMKVEFPFPAIDRLQERIGDSSPLALYSVFMGYSTPYTFFIGASALLAGLLLFFRRTTTLGALLALGVLGDEWMLAFCYDVPTKLFSSHLLAMALFLLAPDASRLADGLLFDRPTQPASLAPPFTGRRTRIARPALKALVVGYALVATTKRNLDLLRERRLAPRPPLYGVYDVERFLRNQAPPPFGDLTRWRRLVVSSPRELTVSLVNGSRRSFSTEYARQSVTLLSAEPGGSRARRAQRVRQGTLVYSRPDPDHLVLQGTLAGDSLTLALRRINESKYLLVTRGLHVIDDSPINQ
jgi:uncharacterized membrane protein YphA (DoxX/SURF4 family)